MVSSPNLFSRSLGVENDEPLPDLPPDQSPLLSSGALSAIGGSFRSATTLMDSSRRTSIQNDNLFNVRPKSLVKVTVESAETKEGVVSVHGWPEHPQELKSKSWLSITAAIGGFLLALTPIAFIGMLVLR